MISQQVIFKRKQPEILIIGGGIAGIAAAQKLSENGFNKVKIIEAENRLGGRINTVTLGNSSVDLGAHWVHGEKKNVVYELAEPLGLLEHSGDFTDVNYIFSNGTELNTSTGMMLMNQCTKVLEDKEALMKTEGSILNIMTNRSKPLIFQTLKDEVKTEAYFDWITKFECSIEGCDLLEEPSAKGLTHYTTCSGDTLVCWKNGGYSNIVNLLLQKFNNTNSGSKIENDVILNCEVEQIDWSGIGVLVKCNNRKIFYADHVIVTTSLGVLKERNKSMFIPSLPSYKRKAIAGLGIGTVNKIYILFPYIWWPKNCSGFSLLWFPREKILHKDSFPWEFDIFGFYTEKNSPNILSAWLVGKSAKEMESYSDEQVTAGCYRVLKKFLSFKFSIPEPVKITRSSWYSNPHFRGSYSFRSINSDALGVTAADLEKPLKNRFDQEIVLFAGEATHSNYYSTVHGAIETGWREAERLIKTYHMENTNLKIPMASL